MTPANTRNMEVIGYSICVLGCIMGLIGELMLLTAVYRRGTILFVVCLMIPFALYGFAVVHIRRLWLPLTLAIAGIVVLLLGRRMAGWE